MILDFYKNSFIDAAAANPCYLAGGVPVNIREAFLDNTKHCSFDIAWEAPEIVGSRSTLIWLRSAKPSIYQRIADARSASSSSGG